eukprot:CAMPEP_0176149480 /NCGR_PEP_ID=MMETSP0120_2-20121206/76269_1 /TAXON_ID=160619 /ORGANISM="Kryptoperidinium foliaceum, Strain CCMP 1326" /LENGTH=150 /DNA_ID=CAMNT_0017486271 /DNA_START=167 /DNA_END=618 /DNA_ORIENTATION=+
MISHRMVSYAPAPPSSFSRSSIFSRYSIQSTLDVKSERLTADLSEAIFAIKDTVGNGLQRDLADKDAVRHQASFLEESGGLLGTFTIGIVDLVNDIDDTPRTLDVLLVAARSTNLESADCILYFTFKDGGRHQFFKRGEWDTNLSFEGVS